MMGDPRLTGQQVPAPESAADQVRYAGESLADSVLRSALAYVACGWPVFPCEIGGKRPAVPRGFKAASTDRNQIMDWWEGRQAAGNIGVPTGVGAFDVLDVEGYGKPSGDGWDAFNRLKAAGRLTGAFRLVRTPSAGLHVYFSGSSQKCSSLKGEHLDFRVLGGYVLVPPSQIDGRPYEVIDDRPSTGMVFDWEAARRLLCPPRPAPVHRLGRRNSGSVAHLPGWMAQQPPGNRNAALYWAACRAAELGDQDVLDELVAAAVQAGLDEAESRRTVASAARTVET